MTIYTAGFIGYCCCLIIAVIRLEFCNQDRRKQLDTFIFIGFGLVAVAFVVFRPIGIVTDDYGYVPKFEALCPLSECGQVVQSSRDYVWYTLVAFGKSFTQSPRVMLALSGATLAFKLFIIYGLSTQRALALLAYITIFYVINDVIAFRVSAAMVAYLFSIYCLALRWPLVGIASNVLSGFIHVQGLLAPLALIGPWLKLRQAWLNVLVLAPLGLLGLGLYPKVGLMSGLVETHWFGTELGQEIWSQIAGLAKGDRKPTRLVPLVVPPALLIATYIYNYAISKKNQIIQQAYFSVGLSAILLWFFGFNSIPQQRFFHYFFLPVILLIGNIQASRKAYFSAIALSAIFMLKYNVMHEMFFEYRKLYLPSEVGGKVTGRTYGISCGQDCYKLWYGAVLWLTASPDESHHFIGWETGCTRAPSSPICRVVMDNDQRIKPIFKQPYQLVTVPSEHGRVWVNKGPIDCGTTCSAKLNPGVTMVLKAWPKTGYYLANWEGLCDDSMFIDCQITANKAIVIQANFQPVAKRLIMVEPPAQGRITSDPPGIDCGKGSSICQDLFSQVTLSVAELGPGIGFTGWNGCEPFNRLKCNPNPHADGIVSLATKPMPDDELLYLGQDADFTGKDSAPDGVQDTHLQLLHTFNPGEELLEVTAEWNSSPNESKQLKGAWVSNRKSWNIKILADGVPLLGFDSSSPGNSRLHGKIRLDIYVPFWQTIFKASNSSYELKFRIHEKSGDERTISAKTIVN